MENRPESLVRATSGVMREIKICVLGDVFVGKSCLATRFVCNTFTTNPSTIGASFLSKPVTVLDKVLKLNIWDTAGSERYRSIAPAYYRGASIALVVYDITSMDSFLALQWWVDVLQEQGPPDVLITIAGNKCDLEEEREVFKNDVELYADSIDALFIETSAKTGENISWVFEESCKRLLEREKKPKRFMSSDTHNNNDVIRLPERNISEEEEAGKKKKCC